MGMFDNVYVNVDDLPISLKDKRRLVDATYQTKSFDNVLEDYYIKNDELLVEKGDWVEVPPEEREYPDPESGFLHMFGSMRMDNKRLELSSYTGTANFYTAADDNNEWFEFEMKVIEGGIVYIQRVEETL